MPVNSFENYPMSWKPKLLHNEKPIYLTLANLLEEDIKSGVLLPGTKLPPQRELADYLDINVSTITRAFKVCECKGLLSATVGRGTFVAYDAAVNTYLVSGSNEKMIEMGAVFPETSSNEELIAQLKEMVLSPNVGRLFDYGRPDGVLWQWKAAVKWMRKAGYSTEIENILLANGGQNAITAVLAGLFKAGDKIGTDPLTYPGFKTSAKMLGIQLTPIFQENKEMSSEGLLYACKNENIKGIYIMPDYQNPTAHCMSLKCREMIAKIANEKNLIVIEDAIHSMQNIAPPPAVANYAPKQTVYLSSLSKTVSPGLRLAYIALPSRYKSSVSNALYNMNLSVAPFLTELTARLIVSEDADKLVKRHRETTQRRNAIVNRYLADYKIEGASECIFRWLSLPKGFTGTQFEALAQKVGVQVYGSERFAVGNNKPVEAVRLAVAATESEEELEEALCRLLNILCGKNS